MENVNLTVLENDIKIYQLVDGFRFSVDPIILVDFFDGKPNKKILEIGSGCGIIPILLVKKNKVQNITGVEIQNSSFEIFNKNILENKLENNIKAIHSDISDFKESNSFDYIISNPPYMELDGKKISENENKKIARHEICLNISSLAKNCKRLLKPRGEVFIVHRAFKFLEISKEFENLGMSVKKVKFVYFDEKSSSNLVLMEISKGRKNILEVLPPLFLEKKGY